MKPLRKLARRFFFAAAGGVGLKRRPKGSHQTMEVPEKKKGRRKKGHARFIDLVILQKRQLGDGMPRIGSSKPKHGLHVNLERVSTNSACFIASHRSGGKTST